MSSLLDANLEKTHEYLQTILFQVDIALINIPGSDFKQPANQSKWEDLFIGVLKTCFEKLPYYHTTCLKLIDKESNTPPIIQQLRDTFAWSPIEEQKYLTGLFNYFPEGNTLQKFTEYFLYNRKTDSKFVAIRLIIEAKEQIEVIR